MTNIILGGGLEHDFYFSIYCESSSQLTNIVQRGRLNHQPALIFSSVVGEIHNLGAHRPTMMERTWHIQLAPDFVPPWRLGPPEGVVRARLQLPNKSGGVLWFKVDIFRETNQQVCGGSRVTDRFCGIRDLVMDGKMLQTNNSSLCRHLGLSGIWVLYLSCCKMRPHV